MASTRKVRRVASPEYVKKVFLEVGGSIPKVAQRLGRSYVAVARRLNRLGLSNSLTARSR